jgi:hypothetical protein
VSLTMTSTDAGLLVNIQCMPRLCFHCPLDLLLDVSTVVLAHC